MWPRDPGSPGIIWPRPLARFRPTSGPPPKVAPPPDPGNHVPPLARPQPSRHQPHSAPAGPPARLSVYRTASHAAEVSYCTPDKRQTPARPHPPWHHPSDRPITVCPQAQPCPRPLQVTNRPEQATGFTSGNPPTRHLLGRSPHSPGPRRPRPGLLHLHHRDPPTPWPAPAHLMPVRHRPPPGTPLLP